MIFIYFLFLYFFIEKSIKFYCVVNYKTNLWFGCRECDEEGDLPMNCNVPGQYMAAYEEEYDEGEEITLSYGYSYWNGRLIKKEII